jgi:DNA polymerase-3 subunit gamma/tau
LKAESQKSKVKSEKPEARLIIETSLVREPESQGINKNYEDDTPKTANQQALTGNQPGSVKLSALEKIRKQVKRNGNNGNEKVNIDKPINAEELQAAWNEYVQKLKEEKNSASTNFEMAELKILDANSFIAIVTNNIQLRFIQQDGQKASQFLREKLQNNLLVFHIVMEENKDEKIPVGTPLTSREQYLKIAEKYPMVKELKDRLRLELDY